MEGRAKDLAEMLDKHPAEAPPSLVIVVDEFATLVKEVPEFVAGIVDIAQRGRSLGIHPVLATQRPSGSVNENILANTNLRISLRMLDRGESTSILDSPEAADIPVPLRGRGFVRLGPRKLVAFQSAYGSAPFMASDERRSVMIAPFTRPDDSPRSLSAGPAPSSMGATHIGVLIDAIAAASQNLAIPEQRRPWRDVLPVHLTLEDVTRDPLSRPALEQPGRHVVFGLLDAPELQEQRPALVDLEEGGGWLIFGGGGSGKSTVLRTVAASLSAFTATDEASIVVFDFASRGLTPLRSLPAVIDVATADDLESVTRHLLMLDQELARRRLLLAAAGAENLTAYNRDHDPIARIVVMIDGFGGLVGAFSNSAGALDALTAEAWLERVTRLVIDGRQVGIHTIATADRRNSVPASIHAAIGNRLILRQTDENSYVDHGIPTARARTLDLLPGRGLFQATTLVQVASVTRDASARAQAEFLTRLGGRLGGRRTQLLASEPLPERLLSNELDDRPLEPLSAWIGVCDVSRRPVLLDFAWSDVSVMGPARSGRSATLLLIAEAVGNTHELYAIGSPSSPLKSLGGFDVSIGRPAQHADIMQRLVNLDSMGPGSKPRILLVDDIDALEDFAVSSLWEAIAATEHLRLVVSFEPRSANAFHPVIRRVKQSRRVLMLQPDDPSEFMSVTGVRLPVRPGLRMQAGRGVLLLDRVPQIIQVAMPQVYGGPVG
jgi:DNA segregation ATPase FtsK/SpoIIIE, S-DNA-T family